MFTWPDGKIYEGYWQNGKQHGDGVLINNGKRVNGTWVDGKRQK